MTIRKLLLLLFAAIALSACNFVDYFRTAETEGRIPPDRASERPPDLQLTDPNSDTQIIFDLGSYCWSGTDMGICADAMPPEYSEGQHIEVDASLPLELVFVEAAPSSVGLSLYPGSNLFAQEAIALEASSDNTGHVSATIPETLEGLYVLAVFATWDAGDAFYTLPIKLER